MFCSFGGAECGTGIDLQLIGPSYFAANAQSTPAAGTRTITPRAHTRKRGTVLGGSIVKKLPAAPAHSDEENTARRKPFNSNDSNNRTTMTTRLRTGTPSQVSAKMSSKEKRPSRDKMRWKGGFSSSLFSFIDTHSLSSEYISTLEGDVAERNQLLDAIRSALGSTQSRLLSFLNRSLNSCAQRRMRMTMKSGSAKRPLLKVTHRYLTKSPHSQIQTDSSSSTDDDLDDGWWESPNKPRVGVGAQHRARCVGGAGGPRMFPVWRIYAPRSGGRPRMGYDDCGLITDGPC